MPGVYINECSNLKEILNLLPPLPKCNWYITDLDCLDHCGWPGCEKWAETKLFLSHEELMQDINYRDPQIIFGVFSAIPADIPKNNIFSVEEPYADGNSCYMKSKLLPQHPDAFLEITPFDAGAVYVISRDGKILEPLYGLSYEVWDEEAANTRMNAELRRINTIIDMNYPKLKLTVRDRVQWRCWHSIFKNAAEAVPDEAVVCTITKILDTDNFAYNPYSGRYMWNPFTEMSELAEDS